MSTTTSKYYIDGNRYEFSCTPEEASLHFEIGYRGNNRSGVLRFEGALRLPRQALRSLATLREFGQAEVTVDDTVISILPYGFEVSGPTSMILRLEREAMEEIGRDVARVLRNAKDMPF